MTFDRPRKVSGAVAAPTITRTSRARTSPRFRPTEPERMRRHIGASDVVTADVVVRSVGVRGVSAPAVVCSLTRRFLS
ncbi:hypothetical protein QE428_001708 [Microbacterium sp. SORGH_AS 505]|nr:hypothetical protein [Microbacterium sp. SORGH_AS_0505]